jgi:hypothetical protein
MITRLRRPRVSGSRAAVTGFAALTIGTRLAVVSAQNTGFMEN